MRWIQATLVVALLIGAVPAGVAGADEHTGSCGSQDDGGSGGDAPDRGEGGALELVEGPTAGCLDETDESDVYRTTLEKGDRLQVAITEATCQQATADGLGIELEGPRGDREAECESDGSFDEDGTVTYVAEATGTVDVTVFGGDAGAVDYVFLTERDTVELPDVKVAAIDDGGSVTFETPVGGVPVHNLVVGTQPEEPRRQRHVSVTIANDGNGTTLRNVGVQLHAAPADCLLPEPTDATGALSTVYAVLESSRCEAERILTGETADLSAGQEITFGAVWDTTRTVGEQRLFASLDLNGAADLDRSNNDAETTTPVLVGTDKGIN